MLTITPPEVPGQTDTSGWVVSYLETTINLIARSLHIYLIISNLSSSMGIISQRKACICETENPSYSECTVSADGVICGHTFSNKTIFDSSRWISPPKFAQSAVAVDYANCTSVEGYPPPWVSSIWHETIWWWGSSNAGALGNTENLFIAIGPKVHFTPEW